MAKIVFSRKDIEGLADRLADCGGSALLDDMPSVQRNMRCAAGLLRFMLDKGIPPAAIEVEVRD